jgi:hypothetical protein
MDIFSTEVLNLKKFPRFLISTRYHELNSTGLKNVLFCGKRNFPPNRVYLFIWSKHTSGWVTQGCQMVYIFTNQNTPFWYILEGLGMNIVDIVHDLLLHLHTYIVVICFILCQFGIHTCTVVICYIFPILVD